ncbi:chromosomal protein D1-like [Anopheles darlingi]|uniref:chromosomal protein D1-like n=1 Tax=Anopheles darlingi TaxID=43151 RepID=UPI00210005B1|nr:chromosomal protein D1-like [Anopheles darlingi]XP_049532410.1 chromosomal protein D1-like [Anopheles darlingi]XP_049532411.1 chromosomal protein D1-like [Anopheles darlingi]
MSDVETQEPKKGRGRPAAVERNSVAPKKRARALSPKDTKLVEEKEHEKAVLSDEGDDSGEEPSPKRGRGRPKGVVKKGAKSAKKAPAATGRGRGRGKKKPTKESSDEEDEDDDDDEEEEEDDLEDSEENEENFDNDESD